MKHVTTFTAALARPAGRGPARVRSRRCDRQLLCGAAILALFAAGSGTAKADDSNAELAREIHALKAQLHHLETRVERQRVQIHTVQVRAATYRAVPPAPYEPPQPWDKKIHLGGITMTPGGFLAMEGVWRSRDEGADIGSTPFGGIPLANSPLGHANELRFSARQSRVSMLVQGNVNPDVLVSGYGELDFLGAANSANSNESNSYNPRIRHMYATVDWQSEGWHLLAGQTWSLATMQGVGITPRKEITPLTIDAQYVAGFTWARQPGVRLVKSFGNSVWLGVSAEMAQTAGIGPGCSGTSAGGSANVGTITLPSGVTAVCNQNSIGGGLLNQVTSYSLNHIPDVIAKGVWEPNVAGRKLHLAAFGMYTDLYDRVYPDGVIGDGGRNIDTAGWGVGADVIVPVLPKYVDLTGSALYGRGIGRYGAGGLSNATFNADGSLDPLPEVMFLAGITVHATPQLELYANGGGEKILSAQYFPGYIGYGNPNLTNNSGCFTEGGTCNGATKDVWEITGGFWDKIYSGAFGSVRFGMQYAYIKRDLFPGSAPIATTGGALLGGNTNEQEALMSFRYYPFDPAPPAPPLATKY